MSESTERRPTVRLRMFSEPIILTTRVTAGMAVDFSQEAAG